MRKQQFESGSNITDIVGCAIGNGASVNRVGNSDQGDDDQV
ncbi:hypothetical protein [Cohnella sp.]